MQANGVSQENSRRPTPTTTESLEQRVGPPRKRRSQQVTSPGLPAFRISPAVVPEALHQPTPRAISLSTLAERLDVPVARLLPAIEHGYIKLIISDPPTVYEPPPGAIEWLREMYAPLALRPLLTIEQVTDILNFRIQDIRRLCLDYDIQIQMDPVFGELMSLASFHRLYQCLYNQRNPARFDRQALLWIMLQVTDPESWRRLFKPPNFLARLEVEIDRISKLKEPARTSMALNFWDRWSSARTVAEVVAKAKGLELGRYDRKRKNGKKKMIVDKIRELTFIGKNPPAS